MYMSAAATTWTWFKEMPFNGEDLKSITFRSSDNLRVALLYASTLLVVLDTSNGNII